jgi:hypothetical protein
MKELILNILALDIQTTGYLNARDCAITRALARAGRPDLIDEGVDIIKYSKDYPKKERVTYYGNKDYFELSEKVHDMYYGMIVPEDFTHKIIIYESEKEVSSQGETERLV